MCYTSYIQVWGTTLKLPGILLVIPKLHEGSEQANGSADFENIFDRISDSKRDFNGFPDPAIAADCGFIYFLGPDFGLCV